MQTMPKYGLEMVWKYHEALMASISAAILASKFADVEVDGQTAKTRKMVYVSDDDSGEGRDEL